MNVYKSVRDSLYKVCTDFKTEHSWAATNYNFDAFAEGNDLPSGDLIGLNGYTMDVDTDLITVRCRIGLATENDQNLFRLDDMAGFILQKFMPDTSFNVYDVDQDPSPIVGQLKIAAGTSISPVYQAIQRPLKFLAFTAHSSLAMSR